MDPNSKTPSPLAVAPMGEELEERVPDVLLRI